MTRKDFQALAIERLKDAEASLQAKRYSCAYYIAGYVVECSLKSCIAKLTQKGDFPPRDSKDLYVHNLSLLIQRAGLREEFEERKAGSVDFKMNCAVVMGWSEEDRYRVHSRKQAMDMLRAIQDPEQGVMQWLSERW